MAYFSGKLCINNLFFLSMGCYSADYNELETIYEEYNCFFNLQLFSYSGISGIHNDS